MQRLKWLGHFLHTALQLQLFLSCLSLPIMLWWGLPFSLLSIIGNLIFTPFLMLFLFLGSVLFLCGLCNYYPPTLIFLLDTVTRFWLLLLSFPNRPLLLYGKTPHFLILCAIPLAAFYVMGSRRIHQSAIRTALLIGILVVSFVALKAPISPNAPEILPLACGKSHHYFIYTQDKTALILTNAYLFSQEYESWAEYTLCSQLAQKYGRIKIDYLIILKPQAHTLSMAIALCNKCRPREIYVPFWSSDSDPEKKIARSYGALLGCLRSCKGTIVRIGNKKRALELSPKVFLHLLPNNNQIENGHTVVCNIDGVTHTITSKKTFME